MATIRYADGVELGMDVHFRASKKVEGRRFTVLLERFPHGRALPRIAGFAGHGVIQELLFHHAGDGGRSALLAQPDGTVGGALGRVYNRRRGADDLRLVRAGIGSDAATLRLRVETDLGRATALVKSGLFKEE